MASPKDKKKREVQRQRVSARAWGEEKNTGFEETSIHLPEGVQFWKPTKEGIYKLEVLPYIVGKNNPRADEGYEYFMRTYRRHGGLGLEGRSNYCCNVDCFNKRCYFCDWLRKEGGSADEEFVKKLNSITRIMMNVLDVTTRDSKDLGIQILEQPFGSSKRPFFGQMLKNKIEAVEDYEFFYDLDKGYTLVCTVQQDSFPGSKPFMKITNIEFVHRKTPLDASLADKSYCLDELLIYVSYDEQAKIFNQETEDEEDEEEASRNGRKRPADDEDEDIEDEGDEASEEEDTDEEDEEEEEKPTSKKKGKKADPTASDLGLKVGDMVDHEDHGECEIIKISKDGTSLTLEDEDGKEYMAIAPAEVKKVAHEDEDEDEDEEQPPKKGGRRENGSPGKKATTSTGRGKKPVDEDEEEEEPTDEEDEWDDFDSDDTDDEDEEEEEPAPKSKKSAPTGKKGRR